MLMTDVVDRVVRTVEKQTSPEQPDKISASKVVLILADHGSMDAQEVREALDQAVDEGRLERDATNVWIPRDES